MLNKEHKFKCEDCESEIVVPKDRENGEIISCKLCSCEYYIWITLEGLKINRVELIGDDWGE